MSTEIYLTAEEETMNMSNQTEMSVDEAHKTPRNDPNMRQVRCAGHYVAGSTRGGCGWIGEWPSTRQFVCPICGGGHSCATPRKEREEDMSTEAKAIWDAIGARYQDDDVEKNILRADAERVQLLLRAIKSGANAGTLTELINSARVSATATIELDGDPVGPGRYHVRENDGAHVRIWDVQQIRVGKEMWTVAS